MSDATRIIRELCGWTEKELFGTNVNRESHLGFIAAREIERLNTRIQQLETENAHLRED